MFKSGLALAALFVSTSAMAQTHDVSISVEAATGVDVIGDINFQWSAPAPGSPYSTSPDSGPASTNIAYTSDGLASGIQVSISNDPLLEWGLIIEATAGSTACGVPAGPTPLTVTDSELISLLGSGSCSENMSVDYSATVADEAIFGANIDGAIGTITYTLL